MKITITLTELETPNAAEIVAACLRAGVVPEIRMVASAASERSAAAIVSHRWASRRRGRRPRAVAAAFVVNFCSVHGRRPTILEVMEAFPDLSKSSAHRYATETNVNRLVREVPQ